MAWNIDFKICVSLLLTQLTCGIAQQCEYINMEVTSEHGNKNVLTIKTLQKSHDSCEGTPPTKQQSAVKAAIASRNQVFIPSVSYLFGEFMPGCEKVKDDIPIDLCKLGQPLKDSALRELPQLTLQNYGKVLVEKEVLPMASGDRELDELLGFGYILISVSRTTDAILHYSNLLRDYTSSASIFYARGVAHIFQGLKQPHVDQAMGDLGMAAKLSPGRVDSLERIAEVNLVLGMYADAAETVAKALKIDVTAKLLFLSGSINFAMDDLVGAEHDFRRAIEIGSYRPSTTLYNLGLTLYHRGKIRSAIEVFKEVVKLQPDHIDAVTTLAQAYKELGNYEKSVSMFNSSKHINSKHMTTLQLLGSLRYYSGQPKKALISFDQCLKQDPHDAVCNYMYGLCQGALGRYYNAIKGFTKAMVFNPDPGPKGAFEIHNAHYLKEYMRYLHRQLDKPMQGMNMDDAFTEEFREDWMKLAEYGGHEHEEQPGLAPHIWDARSQDFTVLPAAVKQLVCLAKRTGELAQVHADAFLPSRRHTLAMGLAAVHIAQHMQLLLKDEKALKSGSAWRELFDLAVQYRRIADPESPVLWLDHMPHTKDTISIMFIKGHTVNAQLKPYFDIVFKLVKTMVEHYRGETAVSNSGFEEELQAANSFEDLVIRARSRKLVPKGLMVATQVPSLKTQGVRLDGIILSLTGGDSAGKVVFSIHQSINTNRTAAYFAEMQLQFERLVKEMKTTSNVLDMEPVLKHVVLLVYYFYNLMPLSRGTSSVAYSVLLGLILATGREVTSNIPPGKLVDMEAILAGAPESFLAATREWLQLKSSAEPVSALPAVSTVFPTLRSVIELLNSTPVC